MLLTVNIKQNRSNFWLKYCTWNMYFVWLLDSILKYFTVDLFVAMFTILFSLDFKIVLFFEILELENFIFQFSKGNCYLKVWYLYINTKINSWGHLFSFQKYFPSWTRLCGILWELEKTNRQRPKMSKQLPGPVASHLLGIRTPAMAHSMVLTHLHRTTLKICLTKKFWRDSNNCWCVY